jgi:hypothetical protein
MTDNAKTIITTRKQRWTRFLDMNQPSGHMVLVRLPSVPRRPMPPLHPDRKQARIEWAWQQYQEQVQRLEWLDDDLIPHLAPHTGTEIFAEAFGCAVHRPDKGMPFALPLITEASEVARLRIPSLDVPCLRLLFEMADELRARSGPEAAIRIVDIQSPMDIAALIWEKSSFFAALIEAPEAVKELASKVHQLLTAFLDAWFARYGTSFVAHCPDYYMPHGITLSEDEVGVVSADMFEEFFLPELVALSNRYGGIGMHCCANSQHQWEGFKRIPGLKLLNLNRPPDVTEEALRFFGPHVAQMHKWQGTGDPRTWLGQLPPGCRFVLQIPVKTREEAIEVARVAAAQR